MFCNQCEETLNQKACTSAGVCGKSAPVADKQDTLILLCRHLGKASADAGSKEINEFLTSSLFATITNANFDENWFDAQIEKGMKILKGLDSSYSDAVSLEGSESDPVDIKSLKDIAVFGLKGLAAYTQHAQVLGYTDKSIYSFIRTALKKTLTSTDADELTGLVLSVGEHGVKTMALLDKANTETYGNPEPTEVSIGTRGNPGILISGHDLKDLKELLEQTKETGVDVYTHGEMLPANYYPEFKKYDNLVGNYGGSWWRQIEEFDEFNGPVLMTTNCLVPPKASYKDRVYMTGVVGFPGLKNIPESEGKKDFSEIIKHAKTCRPPTQIEEGKIVGGFAHVSAIGAADKIVGAIKAGKIKRFFVMAGCDGRQKERNYYEDFAKKLPKDTIILTAGCAKYRYNKLDLGDIDGIPRVLDAGQCNDSYSLVVIALKLAEVFEAGHVNDLPISYNIAWYEQKAVLVLLALLHLGVKNITLGPKLPAFITPGVLDVLVKKFNIRPNTTVEADMEMMLAGN